jgi:hypothetical protein
MLKLSVQKTMFLLLTMLLAVSSQGFAAENDKWKVRL